MFGRLKELFVDRGGAPSAGDRHSHDELQLAAAALMIEAARLDAHFDDRERAAVTDLMQRRFGLAEDEATELVDAADAVVTDSVELYRFARVVKDRFDVDERIELVEMLWRVVYADGVLHDYEANLLRRVAGLIYVSDRDSGAARKRAMESLGIE